MSPRTVDLERHTPRSNPRSRPGALYDQITCVRRGDGTSKGPRAAMLAVWAYGTCSRAVGWRGLGSRPVAVACSSKAA